MISKRKLLRLIKKSLETEEKLIPIYANHCRLFSDYLEFDSSIREQFIEVFTRLRDDSRNHADKLDNLIKIVEKEL